MENVTDDIGGKPDFDAEHLLSTLSPLQRHFLLRLAYLAGLENVVSSDPSKFDLTVRKILLRVKISTLQDCIEQGVGDIAAEIIEFSDTTASQTEEKGHGAP